MGRSILRGSSFLLSCRENATCFEKSYTEMVTCFGIFETIFVDVVELVAPQNFAKSAICS